MPFLWGMRWGGARGDPSRLFPSLPKHAAVRQFWAGSAFGVAVPAQSFNGVIVVHAEAEALVALRQHVGPQALIQALAKEPGIAHIALLDPQLTVLASSDGGQIGQTETDSFLNAVLQVGTAATRRQGCGAGCETVEIVRPLTLESGRAGLLRVGFNTAGVTHVTSQARRGMLLYSVGLLAVGIVASATIFWLQARHLAERRRFEAVVEREGRLSALGNLAAGVAHQIRNPLNAISIGLQRLRMEFSQAAAAARDEYLEFTRVIEAEVRRLNEILERFLALARPLRLALEPEPLIPILEHVATLIAPQAAAQHVRVDTACPLGDRRVAVDRQQLGHALMNIVQNGLQAMPQGGVLTIRAGAVNSREAEVTITDTGPGIPNHLLDRIFEPYFTTKEGGTGLGLALAHRIVVEHGGSVQAGNGDAGGALFVIRLPLLMG